MLFWRRSPIRHSLKDRTEFRARSCNLRQRLDSERIRDSSCRRCHGWCWRWWRRGFWQGCLCSLLCLFSSFLCLFSFFSFFIDFADPEKAGVGKDMRTYNDGTDSYPGGDVLGGSGVFAASTGRFPDFWEVVSLDP